jgi:4-hydroxybenzoate polyprenyltransferase
LLALIRASHPIPSVAVSSFAGLFSLGSGLPAHTSLLIFFAVLLQQISVGLSNDWLDYRRDLAANRQDKPSVSGQVSVRLLRLLSLTAAVSAEVVALFLGIGASLLMLLMLAAGWAYNLGMKSNWSSALPYAVGFGAIPVFVGLAAPTPFWVPTWVVMVSALLGVAAHFANVLPDIEADKLTGVNSLPHILGQKVSAIVIATAALIANLLVVTQSEALDPTLAIVGLIATIILVGFASALSLRAKPTKVAFTLLILASLVNVILLMLGSGS